MWSLLWSCWSTSCCSHHRGPSPPYQPWRYPVPSRLVIGSGSRNATSTTTGKPVSSPNPSIPLIRNRRYQEKGTQLSNPRYPYPIFELLPTPGRVGLFSLSAVIMALNTMTIKWLYGRVNGFGTSDTPTSKPGDIKKDELH